LMMSVRDGRGSAVISLIAALYTRGGRWRDWT
jgi:hypothetical protein